MDEFYGENVLEMVYLIRIFNKFIDCLSVWNFLEGRSKWNLDLNLYRNVNDVWFVLFRNDFLEYIKEWERCVEIREGEFIVV